MAVTILTCPSVEDRMAMLNLWIEVAIECKTAFGNMYGFAGLMFGLCMPQVYIYVCISNGSNLLLISRIIDPF